MARADHFEIRELVPPSVYDARGAAAWELLDPRAVAMLDALRKRFGPCVVNNWHAGGQYRESGFRPASTSTGAIYSQHRYGRAFDCKFRDATPREVFDHVLANPDDFPLITTLEDVEATPTWLHFDTRWNASGEIRIVRP